MTRLEVVGCRALRLSTLTREDLHYWLSICRFHVLTEVRFEISWSPRNKDFKLQDDLSNTGYFCFRTFHFMKILVRHSHHYLIPAFMQHEGRECYIQGCFSVDRKNFSENVQRVQPTMPHFHNCKMSGSI